MSTSRKIFLAFDYTILGLLALATLFPLINQLAISFSSTDGILQHGVTFIPVEFTLSTYQDLAKESIFARSYLNTIIYTITGTTVSLSLTTICAYSLSKKGMFGRSTALKLIIFTMFFAGGLIPNYALVKSLGWIDTIWAIIIPGAILPYHVLIMRTYFEGIPVELEEASKLDGLGQFGYFTKIVLPLSKPIIATLFD